MTKTVLIVEGMKCEMCCGGVTAAIRRVTGVTDASIDCKKGIATITHNGVPDEALIRAVLDAGFKSKVKKGLFK
jgi:copper chaperone CopZ